MLLGDSQLGDLVYAGFHPVEGRAPEVVGGILVDGAAETLDDAFAVGGRLGAGPLW